MDNQKDERNTSQPDKSNVTPSQGNSVYPNPSTGPLAEPFISNIPQATIRSRRTMRFFLIVLAVILLILVGTAGYFVSKDHNTTEKNTTPTSQSIKKNVTSEEPKLETVDTANWHSYSNLDMKISFKYPTSLPVEGSSVRLYPPTAPTEAVQSEVSVEAELGSVGTALIDVFTYKPGSPNDKMSAQSKNQSVISYESKPMTVNGVTGTCEYVAPKYDVSQKHYTCKFTKDNLIYMVGGGVPTSEKQKLFKGVNFWTISQKILETFQFTN